MNYPVALDLQAEAKAAQAGRLNIWKVILAASAGTMIEWYDFYVFGTLGVFLSSRFYPPGNDPRVNFLAFLATFGIGFAIRPLGAVAFGWIGDLVGRKYAFLITLTVMGLSTAAIGVLPTYASIGLLAPALLVALRVVQGLALGGEYGGAATYVAEHAPDEKRGFYTSFIQTTATLGVLLSLVVVLVCRKALGDAAFREWGWRIPFLVSVLLLAVAIYIRVRLRESPLFARLKEVGKASAAPLRESLGTARNWKMILLALFGATAGQAVVWYTGQFYSLYFLQTVLRVKYDTAYLIVAVALLLATPSFIVFGALSDRVGRKKVMLWGCVLAAVTYLPIYMAMRVFATPVNPVALTFLVFVQVVFVAMVYGPVAAFLVEFFPARIRYTSMSLPYHLGNGEFGGWLPTISSALVLWATSIHGSGGFAIFAGLGYPIAIALITAVVGGLWLPETNKTRIWDEVEDRIA